MVFYSMIVICEISSGSNLFLVEVGEDRGRKLTQEKRPKVAPRNRMHKRTQGKNRGGKFGVDKIDREIKQTIEREIQEKMHGRKQKTMNRKFPAKKHGKRGGLPKEGAGSKKKIKGDTRKPKSSQKRNRALQVPQSTAGSTSSASADYATSLDPGDCNLTVLTGLTVLTT